MCFVLHGICVQRAQDLGWLEEGKFSGSYSKETFSYPRPKAMSEQNISLGLLQHHSLFLDINKTTWNHQSRSIRGWLSLQSSMPRREKQLRAWRQSCQLTVMKWEVSSGLLELVVKWGRNLSWWNYQTSTMSTSFVRLLSPPLSAIVPSMLELLKLHIQL